MLSCFENFFHKSDSVLWHNASTGNASDLGHVHTYKQSPVICRTWYIFRDAPEVWRLQPPAPQIEILEVQIL
jgi:hypothetical protein